MNANVCELACDILRATKDGEELAPPDLKLLELAVNGGFARLVQETIS